MLSPTTSRSEFARTRRGRCLQSWFGVVGCRPIQWRSVATWRKSRRKNWGGLTDVGGASKPTFGKSNTTSWPSQGQRIQHFGRSTSISRRVSSTSGRWRSENTISEDEALVTQATDPERTKRQHRALSQKATRLRELGQGPTIARTRLRTSEQPPRGLPRETRSLVRTGIRRGVSRGLGCGLDDAARQEQSEHRCNVVVPENHSIRTTRRKERLSCRSR
jgi:hypothetical protein